MILKNLQLNNFLSHENTNLDFYENQKLLIDGNSGSGKSSLVDALIWVLYGRGRVDNRAIIKIGKKYAKVIASLLDDDGNEYKIERSVTVDGKHELFVLIKEKNKKSFVPVKVNGIRETQEHIEKKIVHSSYLLFINSIVYPQDNPENFLKQTATKRKEIILEIINASDYDDYYKNTKKFIEQYEIKEAEITAVINSLSESIINIEEIKTNVVRMENEIKDVSFVIEKKTQELGVLLDKETEYKIVSSKVDGYNEEIVKKNKEYIVISKEIMLMESKNGDESIEQIKGRIKDNKEFILKHENESMLASEWDRKMIVLMESKPVDMQFTKEKENINAQLISEIKVDVDMCEELNKPCPVIQKRKDKAMLELTARLTEVQKKEEKYIKDLAEYSRQTEEFGNRPTIDKEKLLSARNAIQADEKIIEERGSNVTLIPVKKSVLYVLANEMKELNKKLTSAQKDIVGIEKLQVSISEMHSAIKTLDNKYIELSNSISVNKNILIRAEENSKKLEDADLKKKDITKEIEGLKLLKDAFGNNGIKAIVIDYVIPKLEEKINSILEKISEFRVCIDTQKKGIGEGTIVEGLFIDIINDKGETLSYDSYSGGERIKINVAIFEALASLSNIKFRIMDEAFFALDQDSSDKFLEVMREVRKNVSQFFCISHLQNIKDFFEDKITVIKVDGKSSIKDKQ